MAGTVLLTIRQWLYAGTALARCSRVDCSLSLLFVLELNRRSACQRKRASLPVLRNKDDNEMFGPLAGEYVSERVGRHEWRHTLLPGTGHKPPTMRAAGFIGPDAQDTGELSTRKCICV